MAGTIVVVTFYSRGGATEALAHAAAVGAVQARAGIRLRRVADSNLQALLERSPQFAGTVRQMQKEYVEPREADILAADVLIVGTPADVDVNAPEWSSYVALLEHVHAAGRLTGKVAAVIPNGAAADSFTTLFRRLSLTTPHDADAATAADTAGAVALGRQVVALAHGLAPASDPAR
jgi:hypothetical protein